VLLATRAYDGGGGDAAVRLRSVLFILGFVLLLGAPVAAHADDSPVQGVPGSVRPVQVAAVRLEAEAVQIIVYDQIAECRADFRLVNSGPQRTLRIAFPSVMPAYGEGGDGPDTLGAFHAWRSGRPLAVRLVEGHDGPLPAWFYEHDVALPTGATTVTVDYLFSVGDASIATDWPTIPPAPARWNGMDGLAQQRELHPSHGRHVERHDRYGGGSGDLRRFVPALG
jgi:hypothetical protein